MSSVDDPSKGQDIRASGTMQLFSFAFYAPEVSGYPRYSACSPNDLDPLPSEVTWQPDSSSFFLSFPKSSVLLYW